MRKQFLWVLIFTAPIVLLKIKPFSKMNGGVLLSGGACLLGLFVVGSAFVDYQKSREAQSWPQTTGTVYRSDVRKSKAKGRFGGKYRADVRYRYTVAGVSHTGKKVRFGPAIVSSEEAEATVRRFPEDAETPVFYDPGDPSVAVLEPDRPTGSARTKLFVGLAFVAGGAFLGVAVRNA